MADHLKSSNWGLENSPFGGGLQNSLFFEGASQREALARLRYIRSSGKLAFVTAAAGLGKSLLLQSFATDCRRSNASVAQLSLQGLSTRDFYSQLGTTLGCHMPPGHDLPHLYRNLADRLFESSVQGASTVLLLDDAHQAGPDVMSQLLRLVKHCSALASPPSLVLTCHEQETDRLGAAMCDLIDLRIELEPWDELDTVGYLQLALVEAGCQQPLFDDQSLAEIHRIAGGVPRQVSRLADHALLLGSISAPEIIDSATIRSAHAELSPELAT